MRVVLIFGGLHLCVIALGATMLLLFLRQDRRWSSGEDDDDGHWRDGPPRDDDPPEPPPPAPRPGGLGLPLAHVVPANVRLRPGHVHERWPRPDRRHPARPGRAAPSRTRSP